MKFLVFFPGISWVFLGQNPRKTKKCYFLFLFLGTQEIVFLVLVLGMGKGYEHFLSGSWANRKFSNSNFDTRLNFNYMQIVRPIILLVLSPQELNLGELLCVGEGEINGHDFFKAHNFDYI